MTMDSDFVGDSSANDGLDEAATKATSSSNMDSAKHTKPSPKASKLPRKTMESDDSDNEGPRQRSELRIIYTNPKKIF
jgi:hypothetical protein